MICCLVHEAGAEAPPGALEAIARASSPRVAPHGDEAVVFDVSGLSRVLGAPDVIARDVWRMAAEGGLPVRVAVADTMTSAWVLAHARPGMTVVAPGEGRQALATIPVGWLSSVIELDRIVGASTARALNGPAGEGMETDRRPRSQVRGRSYRMAPSPSAGAPTGRRSGNPHRQVVVSDDRQVVAACRDRLATLGRWGIRTCGELAALRRADIHARMGAVGVRLHQAACGEDLAPLAPVDEQPVWGERMRLEWPIEGLEPLSFVLARLCERLSQALERADRGAVAIHTTLTLVTRTSHRRTLTLPAPLRDARVLRTLIVLDLESHPPPAGIDAVEIRLDVTPGRILQGALLALSIPTVEDLSTLLARLGALMGETRIGAPVCLDTYDARQVAQQAFMVTHVAPRTSHPAPRTLYPRTCAPAHPVPMCTLRRFRSPVSVGVTTEHGAPVRVVSSTRDLVGGDVMQSAGPWRMSGGWWTDGRASWDRDEWDVELAGGVVYRLARIRSSGTWELEGVFD